MCVPCCIASLFSEPPASGPCRERVWKAASLALLRFLTGTHKRGFLFPVLCWRDTSDWFQFVQQELTGKYFLPCEEFVSPFIYSRRAGNSQYVSTRLYPRHRLTIHRQTFSSGAGVSCSLRPLPAAARNTFFLGSAISAPNFGLVPEDK